MGLDDEPITEEEIVGMDEQIAEVRRLKKKWRDSLAAHAMAALVGNVAAMTAFGAAIAMKDITVEEVVAKSAYEFADALIAEGER